MQDKEVRKLAAVMFTDIEGYSAMVQQNEKGALTKVSAHRQFLEQYTSQFNGKVVQFYGDGSLSIYDSAVDAVYCAIEMQKAYRSGEPVPVRIGIHVGDIVFKDNTVFGDGVNIASRIQSTGIPNSILISHRVQTELANHPDIRTKSLGQVRLKNISTPIEILAVTNDGLAVPSQRRKIKNLNLLLRYAAIIGLAIVVFWFIKHQLPKNKSENSFKEESISVPVFANNTSDPSLDQIGQMASHWITKELSSTPKAHVVSYESASEMIKLADINISTPRGQKQYAALTGAVNIVEAAYYLIGPKHDSLLMAGFFTNLETGDVLDLKLKDVKCSSSNPMDCIKAMSDQIKGYWASRDDRMLTPPKYEAYKAYLAARSAWRTKDNAFVFEQLNNAIKLDPGFIDPYFLMLDYFFNEGNNAAAQDTIEAMRKKFTELDDRERNMLDYHTADIEGKNKEAYKYFMKEYAKDSMDMFTNNSAMVLALMYKNDPVKALEFFNEIPFDSLHVEGCSYCVERLDLAMRAALESGNMKVADQLAPKLNEALYSRLSYGMLIMYDVWKNDTMHINQLINEAKAKLPENARWEYLNYLTGRLFLLRGEKSLSLHYAERAIAIYAIDPSKNGRMLARSYYLDDQLEKSLKYYKTSIPIVPREPWLIVAEMGMIYARIGDTTEALKTISKLESMRVDFEYGATEYYQGRIYALLGEKEKAISLLETSLQKGQKFELWATFTNDPDLLSLKDDPEYKKMIGK
ncbi:MAG: adenylate/guanylate cyclase domain-containing protein [Saprospiraceae bacterium]